MSVDESTSLLNEKTKKYDRQLRLWGDDGQTAIEGAKVCVIHAGSLSTETLKNLILPGLGSFTIIDVHLVTAEDVSCSFFLNKDDIGLNRGKVVCKRLMELNPDSQGVFIEESLEEILKKKEILDLTSFDAVIASDVLREESLVKLSKLLFPANIPLFIIRSNGPFALIRLQIKEHCVIQSKPDSSLEDLRLDNPFPSLKRYFDSFDLDAMDRKQVSHVPFVVVLFKMLCLWRQINDKEDNEIPETFKGKEQLKDLIREKEKEVKKRFSEEDERDLDLTNFEEAMKAVNSVLVPSNIIPVSTQALFNDSSEKDPKNKCFWTLMNVLKLFVSSKGCLPLRGSIPDMTCDSASFVQLQKIYSEKRDEDVKEFSAILSSLSPSDSIISEEQIKVFCRNTHCLRVIRTPRIADEYFEKGSERSPALNKFKQMIQEEDMSNDMESAMGHLLCFKAIDRFYKTFNREAGVFNDDEDIVGLKSCLKDVLSSFSCPKDVLSFSCPKDVLSSFSCPSNASRDDLISAFVSFGGSQVHAVSSFVGGLVGQEIIKMLTKQFLPIHHTLIVDAITSNVHTLSS